MDLAQLAWARACLIALMDIDSPSGDEAAMIDALELLAAEVAPGAPVTRIPTPGGVDNLVIGAVDRPRVCLCAHVDTIVPAWPPVATTVQGSVVTGLGAVDDKGGVVACLLALAVAREAGADLAALDMAVAFTVDEEEGGAGSAAVAAAIRPRRVIALEGSMLRPGLVEAGGVEAWVHAEGESGHGARGDLGDLGDNAVLRVARVVAELRTLALCAAAEPFQISGGTELYAIPASCRVLVRARLEPGVASADALAELRALAARHGASVELVEAYDAFATDAGAPFARRLAAETLRVTGTAPEPVDVPAWTDAHNFVDLAGSEAIVFGPGDIATAHRPDERIDVTEIVRAAHILAGLLQETP